MSRQRRPGAEYGSAEHRERQSRGALRANARTRAAKLPRQRDLARLRREGLIAQALLPYCATAEAEFRELFEQYDTGSGVSAARRILMSSTVGLRIGELSETARFLASGDPGALERVSTFANSIRANLIALGLDAAQRDEIDLNSYLSSLPKDGKGVTFANALTFSTDAVDAASSDDPASTPHVCGEHGSEEPQAATKARA